MIISRMVAERGLDADEINNDAQARAAMTLIIEILDMASPPMLANGRVLPLAAITLRAYAELLETSEHMLGNPKIRDLVEQVRAGMREQQGGES